MRVVVLGYHLIGFRVLEALIRLGADIPMVVTHQDDANEEIWFPSVQELARRHGLPVETPRNPNDPVFVERIRRIRPELLLSCHYRKILNQELLDCATRGAFNIHGSLLPKYRGRCPVNWVLIHGEKETGVTIHEMISTVDAGDIAIQKKVPVEEADTAQTLMDKMAWAAQESVEDWYGQLKSGALRMLPQNPEEATCFGGRSPKDGAFSWAQDACTIHNLIRAVTHPYPGAFTPYGGRNLFIWWAQPRKNENGGHIPGTILSLREGLSVATGGGELVLKRVQWAGEEEKEAEVFAKERNWNVGDRIA